MLSTYSVPGSVVGASMTRMMNQMDMVLTFMKLTGHGVSAITQLHIASVARSEEAFWRK